MNNFLANRRLQWRIYHIEIIDIEIFSSNLSKSSNLMGEVSSNIIDVISMDLVRFDILFEDLYEIASWILPAPML